MKESSEKEPANLKQHYEAVIKKHQENEASLRDRLAKQEFRAEKFAENNAAIQKLTGIPSFNLLRSIFQDFLKGNNAEFLSTIDLRHRTDGTYPDRSRTRCAQPALNYFNQFFLTLTRLRTCITEDVLGAIFGISSMSVSRYYNCWIRVMDELFSRVFRKWPYAGQCLVPPSAKIRHLFPKVDLIIDCFEIKIDTPRNPDVARKCKKAYTVKVLVGIECDGNVCFLSQIYQGSISDLAIVKASGLFDRLKPGDVVLADRGFQLTEYAKNLGVIWIVPPSKSGQRGLSADEMKETYRIARVRILVERTIGRLKIWRQLDGPLMISDLVRLDVEIRVISQLCKFLPPLIRDLDDNQDESLAESVSFVCSED